MASAGLCQEEMAPEFSRRQWPERGSFSAAARAPLLRFPSQVRLKRFPYQWSPGSAEASVPRRSGRVPGRRAA
ncbi:MAG: hypothetical protein L6W00_06705 [Lentisphaeria bacterium]|nr:MAG: hypothetical protein L6W00_06705 [Lentisphaeria bacterium]